ncbi:MAG: aminopeptidase [Fimbriimonadaceae bacterium]
MLDPRVTKLAEMLTTHSTQLGKEDTVMIQAFDLPDEVTAELVRVAAETGAKIVPKISSTRVHRQFLMNITEENAKLIGDVDLNEMKQVTAYIGLRGADNSAESSDVPTEKLKIWQKHFAERVHMQQRVPKTKWVVLRWPTPSMAQSAGMSTDQFEDFYFRVCTMDYAKMQQASQPLKQMMDEAKEVRLVGPGTDLSFSIEGLGSNASFGTHNVPDGECFTSPKLGTGDGVIQYNTVSNYQGTEFKNIRFEIKEGKIVDAHAGDNTEKLNEILDSDEGARQFGEFAIGFNPHILHPMQDTLFDEKIAGSFHLTPGNAYEGPMDNGNRSIVHWDIVCIQRPEYGGGEIYFDGKLIRKDGEFVVPELKGLNRDQLGS